jgi:hypothetical protein
MTKIMIGLPSSGVTKTDTTMCLMDIAASLTKDGIKWVRGRAFNTCDESRNMLVEDFLKTDCTHMLFVDWDAIFPADSIQRLLKAGKDIIGVNAAKHETGHPVVTHDIKGEGINYVYYKMQRVSAIGMHLTLIKRKVFETMPWPWFQKYIIHEQRKIAGEDFTFCKNADQNYGFEVWVHNWLSSEIGHIDPGHAVKTLEHVIAPQIKAAEQQIFKNKIKKAKQEAECLLDTDLSN